MNSNYLYDYVNLLERVFSFGYQTNYSTSAIERMISYSSFFQKIEKNESTLINDSLLLANLFQENNINLETLPVYNQCLWAAEAYLRIQNECRLSFEAIFLYIPINKMYDYFPLYHEMDFSHIINEFISLYKKKSVFSLLLEKYNFTLNNVSKDIGISYETLYSLKQRRRDIKKISVEMGKAISDYFNVRLETLTEIKL